MSAPACQARRHGHLEIAHRILLGQRKGADLFDGKGDVFLDLLRHVGSPRLHFLARDNDGTVPLVQLQRIGAHRILAFGLDAGQHLGYDLLGIG